MLLIVNMSGVSVILALDYILAVIDVATKSFTFGDDGVVNWSSSLVEQAKPNDKSIKAHKNSMVNIFEFDFNKFEVIMLESMDLTDTEAAIFTCFSKINMRMEENVILLNGQFSNITMSLSNYQRYCQSRDVGAYIMSPTDLNLTGSIKGRFLFDFFPPQN